MIIAKILQIVKICNTVDFRDIKAQYNIKINHYKSFSGLVDRKHIIKYI